MSISVILTPRPKGSGAIFSNWALGSAGLFSMGSCSLAGTHGFPGPQRSIHLSLQYGLASQQVMRGTSTAAG